MSCESYIINIGTPCILALNNFEGNFIIILLLLHRNDLMMLFCYVLCSYLIIIANVETNINADAVLD